MSFPNLSASMVTGSQSVDFNCTPSLPGTPTILLLFSLGQSDASGQTTKRITAARINGDDMTYLFQSWHTSTTNARAPGATLYYVINPPMGINHIDWDTTGNTPNWQYYLYLYENCNTLYNLSFVSSASEVAVDTTNNWINCIMLTFVDDTAGASFYDIQPSPPAFVRINWGWNGVGERIAPLPNTRYTTGWGSIGGSFSRGNAFLLCQVDTLFGNPLFLSPTMLGNA